MADTSPPGAASSAKGASQPTPPGPACQTCRYRKSRCDRQRPICGVCQRLNTECNYRELLPPKPEKSWSDVLQALQRVELKLDALGSSSSGPQSSSGGATGQGSSAPSSASGSTTRDPASLASPTLQRSLLAQLRKASEQLTVPHKILLWPRIYADVLASNTLMAFDLPEIVREGVSWFARTESMKHPLSLPAQLALPSTPINVVDRASGSSPNIVFPTLPPQQVRQSCAAYFDTFNLLYPILDREYFMDNVQERVLSQGYADGDADSVILLLVLALGQVSMEGTAGTPIITVDGRESGFRGGSMEHPPGLAAFNEARRRFGFIAMECTLETAQILLLQTVYVESHARHLDFWRSVTAASMAFQGLIKTQPIDWTTPYGHQVKCVFWTCAMNESFYHIDLDLPGTDILKFEDDVPQPDFSMIARSTMEGAPSVPWVFHAQFLALIALRSITGRIHDVMQSAEISVVQNRSGSDQSTPPSFVVRELARQLDSWQATLPGPLQWSVTEPFDTRPESGFRSQLGDPTTSPAASEVEHSQERAFDIATGQLRSRYYYARFMLYRPFVYKVLHNPEKMSETDAEFCTLAISSACNWPYSLRTAKDTKRLFPHLFSWTQTCLGILLIFRMTVKDDALRAICDEKIPRQEIVRATAILVDWLWDVQHLDGIAGWCYQSISELLADCEELEAFS